MDLFFKSKRFFLVAITVFFIIIMSIIIYIKTGSIEIIEKSFTTLSIIVGGYVGIQTISDKLTEKFKK